jgi:hypothetical protein
MGNLANIDAEPESQIDRKLEVWLRIFEEG